jgi:Neprosin
MATDQSKLNPELTDWLQTRQKSLTIVKTTTSPSGLTLDWVPIESQVPDGKIASAPPAPVVAQAQDKKRPVGSVTFELDDAAAERGPAGTVPLMRPDLSRLTRTVALKDFLTKKGGLVVNSNRTKPTPADPSSAGYFHGTDSQSGTFYGWDGFLNVWAPSINVPWGSGEDHSILQVWLQNYDKPQLQSLEGGWTVDQLLNGDNQPHVFTYYTTNGYSQDGDNLGGYNTVHKGWVQYSPSVFPGIRINGISTWGGGQTDISMKFQLYQEPGTTTFNWWVAVQGIWIGYYPATLYNGGLGAKAEWVGCGGEVATDLSNPLQTRDQMGSGWQAQAGWTKAAFLRNLRNQTDLAGTMVNNDGSPETDTPRPVNPDPYTVQLSVESDTTWASYFYVGGPTSVAAEQEVFNQLSFDIETGGDDLRGDSSATASVVLPGGTQTFTLKAQSDAGWGNNSDHVKTFGLSGPPQPLHAFGQVTITLTSHNGFLETDDNWNIQSVVVTAIGTAGSAIVLSRSGNPLARLTGSAPSVTLDAFVGA